MCQYTTDELKNGRFLPHFMGFEARIDTDPTEEQVALPARVELPPTRVILRPRPLRVS